jgi:flagellin
MAITIATNVASLSAQTNLASTTASLQKSFERLSSGLRITSASDDAAGLAVADNLRADTRIAGVALRNANDGISLISIADGAMKEIGNILQRQAELAEQSANGTFSASQRSALQSEFVSLGNEIERIAESTEFNQLKLIGSAATNVTLQVGLDATSNSQITFSAAQGTLAALGLAASGSTALNVAVSTAASALTALTSVKAAISSLTTNRGTLGAAESRLNSAISNLQVARENFSAAESAIRDVDVASEAANLTRNNILQQAGAAVLAQANQQPSLALSLLG